MNAIDQCEVCGERPPVGLVVLEDGTARLCEVCIADGQTLGLIEAGGTPAVVERAAAVRAALETAGFVEVRVTPHEDGHLLAAARSSDGIVWALTVPPDVPLDRLLDAAVGVLCQACGVRSAPAWPQDAPRLCGACSDVARALATPIGGAA